MAFRCKCSVGIVTIGHKLGVSGYVVPAVALRLMSKDKTPSDPKITDVVAKSFATWIYQKVPWILLRALSAEKQKVLVGSILPPTWVSRALTQRPSKVFAK